METAILETWWPLIVILLGWMLYLYLTWNHDYWKKRGVPFIKPLPVFGNLKDIMLFRKFAGEVYQEIYKKFDGYKYGGVYGLGKPALFMRDPDLIKDVLVSEFSKFHDNELTVDENIDPMIGRNPFVLKGDRWKTTRSRLLPGLTAVKLKPLFPLVEEVCGDLNKLISSSSSGELEAKELCCRFTTDMVATCAYGVNGNALKDPESEFRCMGRAIINPDFSNKLKFMIAFLAPSVASIFKLRGVPKKVEDFFLRLVNDVIKFREEKNVSRNDYMQHLISLKKKSESESSENNYPFDVIDAAAAATTFFFDGFETSAGAMSFVLYCLAVNPEVQSKVRDEVYSVLNENGDGLSYDNIQKMTYLEMVFSETLRMYPPVMFMRKMCTNPTKMEMPSGEGELMIEVGTPVIIPIYALHHDPKYYPDPDVFIPERFTEENKKARHKYVYLAFSEGPRICLGSRFAHMQIKAGIASILTKFEVKPTDRTPIPLVPDPTSIILAPKEALWLKFSPHNFKS